MAKKTLMQFAFDAGYINEEQMEKAKEYKKILDLKASENVRDTFYSEILDIIAAY